MKEYLDKAKDTMQAVLSDEEFTETEEYQDFAEAMTRATMSYAQGEDQQADEYLQQARQIAASQDLGFDEAAGTYIRERAERSQALASTFEDVQDGKGYDTLSRAADVGQEGGVVSDEAAAEARSNIQEEKEDTLKKTYEGARTNAVLAQKSKELMEEAGVYSTDADREAREDIKMGEIKARKTLSDLPDEYEGNATDDVPDIMTEEGLEKELERSRQLLDEIEEETG